MATMNNNNNNARNTNVPTPSNTTLLSLIPLIPAERTMMSFSKKDKNEERTVTIALITSHTIDLTDIISNVIQFYTFTSHPWNEVQKRSALFSMTLQDIVAHGKWKTIKSSASEGSVNKKDIKM
jgi:hypothetical protein